MTAEWDPEVPIKTLFGKIEDACEYASFSNRNIPKEELIYTDEVLLLKTGHFGQDYKDWRSVENADRNWDYFQEWWQEAYDLREDTTTNADQFGFGGVSLYNTRQANSPPASCQAMMWPRAGISGVSGVLGLPAGQYYFRRAVPEEELRRLGVI